jgi:ABC-2 type transport system ATP-binding protein
VIELQGVYKRFNGVAAVDGVDTRFGAGRLTGFLGPNGAGKSTTIRMIMGIILPDSGRILAGERPLVDSLRDRFGYLPEERGLYRKMKVLEHLCFFAALKGLPRALARRRAMGWLERLDLADWSQNRVEDLSKGMQQKIQFMGALLHEPDLILLDEPFSGLDPINTEVLKDIMLELKAEGRTVIFSTHMMDHAERLCDDIVLIDRGRLLLAGSTAELRASFGRSHLRVRFSGDGGKIAADPRVESYRETAPGEAELKLADESEVSRVLRDWSAALDLNHFEVILPSLHNIFIQTVSERGALREGVGS